MNKLKILSNLMEDDGIRLQMEAEERREFSEKEWMEKVKEWLNDCHEIMADLSCSLKEAYKEIMQ